MEIELMPVPTRDWQLVWWTNWTCNQS